MELRLMQIPTPPSRHHRHAVGPDWLSWLHELADTSAPVLIQGPPGAETTRLARLIHRLSGRHELVTVPASLPEEATSLRHALCGEGRYPYRTDWHPGLFQAAQGGTLLLEDVGTLGTNAQALFAQVLAEGTYYPLDETSPSSADLRVIATAHQDLAALVDAGRFRADLYAVLFEVMIDLHAFSAGSVVARRTPGG
jgi:DNA-binding NtrC family response regulator